MANVMLAFNNRIDSAILTGGNWRTTLPIENLQDRQLGIVARSTNDLPASTLIDAELEGVGSPSIGPPVQVIALLHHNLSQVSEYGITGDNTTLVTPDYDSEVLPVWPVTYSADQLAAYPWNLIHIINSAQHLKLWELGIIDYTNTDGYVQAGRMFMGQAWQPNINMMMGPNSMGWETTTQFSQSLSGAKYFDRRPMARVAKFTVDALQLAEAMAFYDMQGVTGIDREVLFIYDPADTTYALQRSFLGTFRTLSPLEHPRWSEHEVTCEVVELLP